jgi:urease accessory protein
MQLTTLPAVSRADRAAVFPLSAAGAARIGVTRTRDRSVVRRAYARSPLRLLTPANHGRAAWIYSSSFGGGLVDGDHLAVRIDVDEGAAAFLSTQASTKVYRSPSGASSEMHARVANDGLLVVAPDPIVCFAGARFRQLQTVELAPRAGLVLLDWVSSGRIAAGERWAFDEYRSQLRIRVDDDLVVHDSVALRAVDGDLRERLGRFNVLAAVTLIGAALADRASAFAHITTASSTEKRPNLLVAATLLRRGGRIIRFAGTSVEQVSRAVHDLLNFVPALLGDDPFVRKW